MEGANRCEDCGKFCTKRCDTPARGGPGALYNGRAFACEGYEYCRFTALQDTGCPTASVETVVVTGNPSYAQLEDLQREDNARDFSEVLDILVEREGEPETLEEAYGLISQAAESVMWIRHQDYGAKNISEDGRLGVAIRAGDKLARIKNLLKTGNKAKGEPREDAWGDLANYGKIGVLLERDWWDLPAECLEVEE